MEKLIELLNEYEKEKKSGWTWRSIDSYDNCVYGVDSDGETEITMYSDLYSKHYGFIQWLVDNDKIDNSKMEYEFVCEGITYPIGKSEKGIIGFDGRKLHTKYESILMLLSIQDNPIEFLISILK